jgi:membrane protease YdiL (CAAX protease family)
VGELTTQPPPDLPEVPAGATRLPAWPPLFAVLGFIVGLIGTLLLVGVAAAVVGVDSDGGTPAFVVIATLAQGAVFAATALFFAARIERPRAWHFGLRGTRFWPALGWAALGLVGFYFVTAIYGALVQPDAEQGTVEALGGDQGTFGLIVAGVMVICIAPVVEEFFFRGFFYRALRSRYPMLAAATMDGLLFGLIHFQGDGVDGLLILPPLALLGFAFCLVYERTGSLLPCIGMHAFNNTLAYAVQADEGWKVAVVAGPLMFAAVALAPRFLPRAPRLGAAFAPG